MLSALRIYSKYICERIRNEQDGGNLHNCGDSGLTGLNHNDESDRTITGIRWIHIPAILPAGAHGSWPAAVMKSRRTDGATTTTHGTSLTTRTKRSTTPTTSTSPIPVLSSTTDDKNLVTIGLIIALAASLLTNAGLIICLINVKMKTKSNSPSSSSGPPEPAPGEMGSSVKADGKPKRREDLLYQNNEDTEEQYYSRADSRYKSVNYDDIEADKNDD